MGNQRLEQHQFLINKTSPIMSKMIVIETQRQHARVGIIQSLNVGITTTRVEMVIEPNINAIKRGILNRSITKLSSRSSGILARRNLSRNSMLPMATTRVVGIPQMLFIR